MELYSVSLAVYYPKKQQVNSAEPAWFLLSFLITPTQLGDKTRRINFNHNFGALPLPALSQTLPWVALILASPSLKQCSSSFLLLPSLLNVIQLPLLDFGAYSHSVALAGLSDAMCCPQTMMLPILAHN